MTRDALSRGGLAALLAGSGILHLVYPGPYRRIVPGQLVLGHVDAAVLVSGIVEVGCAAALLTRRTRRPAAWLTVLLFICVFPANVKMAVDAGPPVQGSLQIGALVTWLRLPLQLPLILWARSVGRQSSS